MKLKHELYECALFSAVALPPGMWYSSARAVLYGCQRRTVSMPSPHAWNEIVFYLLATDEWEKSQGRNKLLELRR